MKKFSFVIINDNNNLNLIETLKWLNHIEGYGKDDYEVVLVDISANPCLWRAAKDICKNYELQYIFLGDINCFSSMNARNHGWKSANGEIVIFIDPNFSVCKDYLLQLDRSYSLSQRLVVIGPNMMMLPVLQQKFICPQKDWQEQKWYVCEEKLRYLFDRYSYNVSHCLYPYFLASGSNICIPKNWLRKAKGFYEEFNCLELGCMDLVYRLQAEGAKVIVNSKLKAYYCSSGQQYIFHKPDNDKLRQDIDYFYSTAAANDMERDQLQIILEGKNMEAIFDMKKESCKKVVCFKDRKKIEELKEDIVRELIKADQEIIVKDYVEDTDLDTWIQLLGRSRYTPRYFPVSESMLSGHYYPQGNVPAFLTY